MSKDKYEKQVLDFVSLSCSIPVQKLTMSSTLQGKLGLDGDDADEFMNSFFEEFQIDRSSFNFEKYFSNESSINPFSLFWKSKKRSIEKIDLSMLANAVKTRRW
ncbi:DUF1493 family protein [Pseudoalteromonas viridis]|uniref:DUF1493 family protein n=1 Tax=Pseudoalteromonas viridis TaxID=339617 RepID=A0ABX7V6N7_9GAMM|nr:DUF1493 family protein [Pseudoalteromonas viridis]QTL36564.1 DUF1493 family protein [Pseudoalteromonas viridis]